LTKIDWATFWAIFFSNSSGHTVRNLEHFVRKRFLQLSGPYSETILILRIPKLRWAGAIFSIIVILIFINKFDNVL
jgi:hypothetical protein